MENTTLQMLQAIQLLTSNGLKFTSNPRQLKNGTLEFTDPKGPFIAKGVRVKYTLHANGYYRKYCSYNMFGTSCYQLNRTRKLPVTRFWCGAYHTNTEIQRILIPGQYLLMAQRILANALKNRK